MNDALLLHLDPDATAGWWLATDHLGNGIGSPRHASLAEVARAAAGRPLSVLFPAERCVVLEVRAPVRDRAQLLRALPGLVEDRLSSEVEQLHLSAGPFADDGSLRVVAIEHGALRTLLAALAAAGLDPEVLVPDALCLPGTGDALGALDGRILFRTRQRAAAVAPAIAALLLSSDTLDTRVELSHSNEDPATLEPLRVALAARGVALDERPVARHELERALLRGARAALGYNVRHGRHRRHGAAADRRRTWRLPLALAALWFVLVAAASAVEIGLLLRERVALDAELAQLLPSAAPEALGQPDPRFYLDQRLKRRAGGGGVSLDDVVRAAGALRAVGGAELMLVDAREGALELGVRAGDLAALEAARGAVSAALARGVELHGASSSNGAAEARLVIGAGAAP